MKPFLYVLASCLCFSTFNSCKSDEDSSENATKLNFTIKFDPTQERLDNLGQPATIPADHAALSPNAQKMSIHYIELAPSPFTPIGEGEIVYMGEETTLGGEKAIYHDNAILKGNNETFFSLPLKNVTPGSYTWIRVSLAYQEGTIQFLANNGTSYNGTLASFVGYNTYISDFDLNGTKITVNDNKKQGFWGFETLNTTIQGQAPEGATTVPNPLFESSPIPQGSCIVTGEFENEFIVTGNEDQDVTITLSFSTNNSFEWTEVNYDGMYEPSAGEVVVDMGLRGLIPFVTN